MTHHALAVEPVERLVEREFADIPQRPREEARIKEVENGVFNPPTYWNVDTIG